MTDADTIANPLKLMGHAHRTFARIADAQLRDLGLAVGQLPVLLALKTDKALTQSELARIAQVEQPSMAQLLSRMERDDLVKRVPDPNDKRSRLISLTPSASRRMLKGRDIMDRTCATALKGFGKAEIDLLATFMQRINANLDGVGGDGDN